MIENMLSTLERLAGDERPLENPEEAQEKVLLGILRRNQHTLFGREWSFGEIHSAEDYTRRVPLATYDGFKPYIDRMALGEENVLLGDFPRWGQTSGTLGPPKLYPFPAAMAEHFGMTLARIICSVIEEEPDRKTLLEGKMLMVVADVATHVVAGKPVGYISGIVSHDVQRHADLFTPPCNVLAMEDWEARWLEMTRRAAGENVTMSCSTPPILLSYLKKVSNDYSSRLNLPEDLTRLWPNLGLITGAGVKMGPYERKYQKLLGDNVCCREFYCATEGFFAYQKDDKGMVPILDHIFYEFIPLDQWEKAETYRTSAFTRLPYWQVSLNEDYVMAVTTPGGLYSYVVGDIVRFLHPDRIAWRGRVGRESNVAGEKLNELHVTMVKQSVETTLGVEISNQVTAVRENPLQYIFAFEFEGDINVNEAIDVADKALRDANPIYDDLRKKNVLKRPDVTMLKPGTFDRYFRWSQNRNRKKSLGQVKPPIFVSPELVEELQK